MNARRMLIRCMYIIQSLLVRYPAIVLFQFSAANSNCEMTSDVNASWRLSFPSQTPESKSLALLRRTSGSTSETENRQMRACESEIPHSFNEGTYLIFSIPNKQFISSQTCFKQAPLGESKILCLRQVLA